jgi:hypothetical protein
MRSTVTFALAVTLGAVSFAVPANAQSFDDGFWARLSGNWSNVDTDVSVSSVTNGTIGTEIDLEEDLGFDDGEFLTSFQAGARLGGAWSIMAEYYSLGRDSTANLARDIVVDDVTYPAAATVTAGFSTDIYRLAVQWEFARGENYAVGGALGLHATDVAFSLDGQGRIGNQPLAVQQRRQDVLAPLPTLGLFGRYEVAPNMILGGRAEFMSLSIDKYDGRLLVAEATFSYRFMRNVGVGVMWRYVDYRLDVEREASTARFDYSFSGPGLFLEVGF